MVGDGGVLVRLARGAVGGGLKVEVWEVGRCGQSSPVQRARMTPASTFASPCSPSAPRMRLQSIDTR